MSHDSKASPLAAWRRSRDLILRWINSERTKSVLVAAGTLFLGSVVCDAVLHWFGKDWGQTLVDNIVMGAAGGLTVWVILSLEAERQQLRRARELMRLTAELNNQVRSALTVMANGAMLQNEAARLEAMDEAMQEIDHVLTEVVPTVDGFREHSPSSGF